MSVLSAGLLLYRRGPQSRLEVWIGHMGGPFWARKDAAAWSIPKGEYTEDEDALAAARREFAEEIGTAPPDVDYFPLGSFRQASGKFVTVFAAECDFRPERSVSNTFSLEWPRGSGIVRSYPEIDDAAWFSESEARTKLVRGQLPVLDALLAHLREAG
ncbi:NUDIX domain-containing protein [Arthrobacter sp. YAF16]|uniref:NUDIX domain-containing protein n=1 Tax=Arthrobacter sp. YAF16 TaxID=3233076 RepID=UPI003F91548D